jgi:transposase
MTMAYGRPRDGQKEQQWRRWLREWQSSGLSVRAFCERHHLSEPRFYAWRGKLAKRDAQRPAFVPVQVVADEALTTTLELVLAGGRKLRVPAGFDAATLRQLLAVLEEQPPC